MALVRIVYQQEGDSWWAESPDVDGFTAGGDSLAEVRQLAREGVAFYVNDADLDVREQLANGGLMSEVRADSLEHRTVVPSEPRTHST